MRRGQKLRHSGNAEEIGDKIFSAVLWLGIAAWIVWMMNPLKKW